MVPGPVGNAVLHTATLQLQKNTPLLNSRSLLGGNFGQELMRQLGEAASMQVQNLTSQAAGTRPITFVPTSAEAPATATQKGTTSKRDGKKKSATSGTGTSTLPVSSKR